MRQKRGKALSTTLSNDSSDSLPKGKETSTPNVNVEWALLTTKSA